MTTTRVVKVNPEELNRRSAPISVHDHRNRRSRSSGTSVHHRRNTHHVAYAQKKVASVRRLHRTSEPIPHAGGTYPPKPPAHILGGLLTLDSDWNPALGEPLLRVLSAIPENRLDFGCVAAHGIFSCDTEGRHALMPQNKPATAFLLELIARLQGLATVPDLPPISLGQCW